MNNQPPILIEIVPNHQVHEDHTSNKGYDVYLHKYCETKGTHWESFKTVPFKFVGFLSEEEVGQYMGGS